MKATETYRQAADAAQSWASQLADDVDFEKVRQSTERAAQKATEWAADSSAVAGEAAHRVGDWFEKASDSATDWIEDQSSKAIAMLPAVKAARRARRRRWIIGSVIAAFLLFYFYDPDKGRERRAKLTGMFRKKSKSAGTSTPSFSTSTVNEAETTDVTSESSHH